MQKNSTYLYLEPAWCTRGRLKKRENNREASGWHAKASLSLALFCVQSLSGSQAESGTESASVLQTPFILRLLIHPGVTVTMVPPASLFFILSRKELFHT